MDSFMQLALKQAQLALKLGELPIGAVLVSNSDVLFYGHTRDRECRSFLAHAEMLLLQELDRSDVPRKSLKLYTTLEPCTMCLGAAINLGVEQIYYGMKSLSDGCTLALVNQPNFLGIKMPELVGPLADRESKALFLEYLKMNPKKNGYTDWVRDTLPGKKKSSPATGEDIFSS